MKPQHHLPAPAVIACGLVVTVCVAAAFLRARPLLEEYGFLVAWRAEHLSSYLILLESKWPLRPLVGLPFFAAAALSTQTSLAIAFGLTMALIIGAQCVFAFLLLSRVTFSYWWQFMLAFVALATLAPWPGEYIFRATPGHLSAVLIVGAFGLTLVERSTFRDILLGLTVFAALSSYQGGALVLALVVPIVTIVVCRDRDRKAAATARRIAPILGGFAGYGLYTLVATQVLEWQSYEGDLVGQQSASDIVAMLPEAVLNVYRTAYTSSPWLLVVCSLVFLTLISGSLLAADDVSTSRARRLTLDTAMFLSGIALAPMTALTFIAVESHQNDPERVLLPVSLTLAFTLTAVLAVRRLPSGGLPRPARSAISEGISTSRRSERPRSGCLKREWFKGVAICATVLTCLAMLASNLPEGLRGASDFRASTALLAYVRSIPGTRAVQVQDYTGQFGDVQTVYGPEANLIARGFGIGRALQLCTPTGVKRDHPLARRLGITSTIACRELKNATTVRLVETKNGYKFLVRR